MHATSLLKTIYAVATDYLLIYMYTSHGLVHGFVLGARGRSGKGKSGALGGRGEANCLHFRVVIKMFYSNIADLGGMNITLHAFSYCAT